MLVKSLAKSTAASILVTIALIVLAPASARAQLDLPQKTIVVRDFARLRQDLLDTLQVNVPDAEVEIVQFRGAEVVLSVAFEPEHAPEDLARAEAQLRKHCDKLIRAAAKGMTLAPSSKIQVIIPIPEPSEEPASQALLERLRSAIDGLNEKPEVEAETEPEPEPEGPPTPQDRVKALLTRSFDEDEAAPDALLPPSPPEKTKDLDIEVTVTTVEPDDEALYGEPDSPEPRIQPLLRGGFRAYLSRVTGKSIEALQAERTALLKGYSHSAEITPTKEDPATEAVPQTPLPSNEVVSEETLTAMERYRAELRDPETGLARVVLQEEQDHRIMVKQLSASTQVSEETRKQIQDFKETGRILHHGTSQDTIRAIYQQIYADRHLDETRTELDRSLHLPPGAALGALAQRPGNARYAEPISTRLDELLTEEIQSLFDSGSPPDIEEAPSLE